LEVDRVVDSTGKKTDKPEKRQSKPEKRQNFSQKKSLGEALFY